MLEKVKELGESKALRSDSLSAYKLPHLFHVEMLDRTRCQWSRRWAPRNDHFVVERFWNYAACQTPAVRYSRPGAPTSGAVVEFESDDWPRVELFTIINTSICKACDFSL